MILFIALPEAKDNIDPGTFGAFTLPCRQQPYESIAAGASVEQSAPHRRNPSRSPDSSTLRRPAHRRLLMWGHTNCMGRVRAFGYDAAIGVGGLSAQDGIAGKLVWIGTGPHRHGNPLRPLISFDRLRYYRRNGEALHQIALDLAARDSPEAALPSTNPDQSLAGLGLGVPKLFQKSNFNLRNGFYSERKQTPGISVRPWKVWANVTPKMYAALPYKQGVRGQA